MAIPCATELKTICAYFHVDASAEILSQEVLLHIFSFLGQNDLLSCRSVCREWKQISEDDALGWRVLFERVFGRSPSNELSLFAEGAALSQGSVFHLPYTVKTFPHSAGISALTCHAGLIISAHDDCHIRIWFPDSIAPIQTIESHVNQISVLRVIDNSLVADAPSHHQLQTWNVGSWKPYTNGRYEAKALHLGTMWGLERTATYCDKTNLFIQHKKTKGTWGPDSASGLRAYTLVNLAPELTSPFPLNYREWPTLLEAHEGRLFAAMCGTSGWGMQRFKIYMWDCETRKQLHTFKTHTPHQAVTCLAFWHRLMFSGHLDGAVRLWHLDTHERLKTFNFASKIEALSVAADGQTLCIAQRHDYMTVLHFPLT